MPEFEREVLEDLETETANKTRESSLGKVMTSRASQASLPTSGTTQNSSQKRILPDLLTLPDLPEQKILPGLIALPALRP